MPKPLVILFWIWLLISVGIYLSRFYRRMTSNSSTSGENESSSVDGGSDELPLDSPERWERQPNDDQIDTPDNDANRADVSAETTTDDSNKALDSKKTNDVDKGSDADEGAAPSADELVSVSDEETSVAQPVPAIPHAELSQEPAVAAALAEQARHDAGLVESGDLPANDSLPVGDIAARLDPLVEESHIEPSVLSAMSPTQRAAMGVTAATATGGLFDPQVRTLVDDVEYDHKPLSELLAGIALPCDLIPIFRQASNDHYAVFTTTSAGVAEVAAKVASQLEGLGFAVSPRPPSGARATRDTSAVDIVVTLVEESVDQAAAVEIEFSSL